MEMYPELEMDKSRLLWNVKMVSPIITVSVMKRASRTVATSYIDTIIPIV